MLALGLLLIIGSAFVLTRLEPEATEPTPEPNPVVAPQPPPVVVTAPMVVPPPVEKASAPVDAGTVVAEASKAVDVLFHVKEGKATAAGQRLGLRKGSEDVSGLVDVMGHVTLPLTPGRWQITQPERTYPYEVEVRDEMSEVELEVLDPRTLVVRGVVLGEGVEGIPSARVAATNGTVGLGAEADARGHFHITHPGLSSLTLFAYDDERRSPRVTVTSGTEYVVLRLEATTPLVVTVVGPGADTAGVNVQDRSTTRPCGLKPCTIRVLGGPVLITASSHVGGEVFFAKKLLTIQTTKQHEVTVQLKPAPPVRGTLFGPNGAVLPGVSLELWSSGAEAQKLTSTVTLRDGSFTVAWPAFADAASVRVGPLYALDREALVSPGDAPLLISAHPVGMDAQ